MSRPKITRNISNAPWRLCPGCNRHQKYIMFIGTDKEKLVCKYDCEIEEKKDKDG